MNWSEIWDCNTQQAESEGFVNIAVPQSQSTSFILGLPLMDCRAQSRSLRQSLQMLQAMIRSMSFQWGISKDMVEILLAWTSKV